MVKIVRLTVLGGEKVGKTCIIQHLAFGRDVTGEKYEPTSDDTYTLNVDFEKACLVVQDTSGADFKHGSEIRRQYLSYSDGYVLVYAVDCPESFLLVESLKSFADKNVKDKKEIPIVVLGNKKDLAQANPVLKRVDSSSVAAWAAKAKVKFYEVSARDRQSLVEPMAYLSARLLTVQKEPKFTLTKRLKEKQSGPAIMMDL